MRLASPLLPVLTCFFPHLYLQQENSPLNVGMAPASWRNSYYAPDAAAPWTMQFYDYPGSLNVPNVNAYEHINE